jgi:uncharacterized protein (TIGR03086 family)
MDPITMFERAARNAARLARSVQPSQLTLATPCSEWDVAELVSHLAGGPEYLRAAMAVDSSPGATWPDDAVIDGCLAALRRPGVLEQRCQSPAGFDWSIAEAVAGTAMDQLIHTWDLAVALGTDRTLDPDVVGAIVTMFLPQMPEIGRQAGLVGPEVAVADDAPVQHRLLGAMGRNPEL